MYAYGKTSAHQASTVIRNMLFRRTERLSCRIPEWKEKRAMSPRTDEIEQLEVHLFVDNVARRILEGSIGSHSTIPGVRMHLYDDSTVSDTSCGNLCVLLSPTLNIYTTGHLESLFVFFEYSLP